MIYLIHLIYFSGDSKELHYFLPALLATKSPSVVAEYDFFGDMAMFELPFVAAL